MVQIWTIPIVLSVTKVWSRSYVGNHGNDRRTCARSVAAILDLTSSRPFLHRSQSSWFKFPCLFVLREQLCWRMPFAAVLCHSFYSKQGFGDLEVLAPCRKLRKRSSSIWAYRFVGLCNVEENAMIGSEIFVWRVHTESNLKVQLVNIERMHRSVAFVLIWITGMNCINQRVI